MDPETARDATTAYLIQYLGLGLVFWIGLFLAWRQGEAGLKTKRQRFWLLVLVGGFAFYAGLHGLFQFVLSRV